MRTFKMFENVGSSLFAKSGEGDTSISSGDTHCIGNGPVDNKRIDFGESADTNNRSSFINGLFDVHQLTSLLSYATFDDETDLFYNQDSVGFVLETETLVGANVDIQTQIQNFFNTSMECESSLQVMLYADPMISDKTDHYQQTRQHATPIIAEMTRKRSQFFESLCYDSTYSPYTVRTFRVIWSFSCPVSTRAFDVLTVREQLVSTLSMMGLNPFTWKPVDLLQTVDSILHLLKGQTHKRPIAWNPYQNLSDQLAALAYQTTIGAEAIDVDAGVDTGVNVGVDAVSGESMSLKTFTVTSQPDEWSLGLMADLIGSEQSDRSQIGCPFLLHYGVFIPKQDGLKAKIFSKESIVSKQANSAISKLLPHLKRESAELSYVLGRLNTGDRIVQTNMSLILMAPTSQLNTISNAVQNIFITQQWKLHENKRFHLPMVLSCLPMSWSKELVSALEFHKMLKTTLTTEVANNLPCQGEWRGSTAPCLLLAGRKGQIFTWSPFENDTNYNTIVVGTSGSGKSVAMQELMMSLLGMGARVVVFDLGRSFEKSCHLVGGQHIRFEKNADMCINPFSFVEEGTEEADANERRDQLEAIAMTMEQMAARREGMLDIQGNFLQRAVMETFAVHGRQTTVTDVVETLNRHEDPRARDVGTLLFNYTKDGSYGKWFEGQANVDRVGGEITSPVLSHQCHSVSS